MLFVTPRTLGDTCFPSCLKINELLFSIFQNSGPPFSQERMTSNSFVVCFESWAPPVLKSGRFAGAYHLGGEGVSSLPPAAHNSPALHLLSSASRPPHLLDPPRPWSWPSMGSPPSLIYWRVEDQSPAPTPSCSHRVRHD